MALILCTSILNAQERDSIQISKVKKESYLSFDAFSSLNVFSPRWRIGYIRSINPKWKIGLNLGYGNKNISYTYFLDHFEESFKLWEFRPEIYKIFNRNEKAVKYVSIELFYINHKDVFHNEFYYPEEGGEISYDQADYQRHKYGFNFNVGEFINIRNCFGLNIFTGLGLRMRDVSFTNVVNPRSTETFVDMINFYQYREKEGLDFGLSYSLGLKLLF
jgi:hypothetical protein